MCVCVCVCFWANNIKITSLDPHDIFWGGRGPVLSLTDSLFLLNMFHLYLVLCMKFSLRRLGLFWIYFFLNQLDSY